MYDQAGNTTAACAGFKTLTSYWVQPTTIVSWSSPGSARGSIATLSGGSRVAIVWNDGSGTPIQSIGLNIASAHDQDGSPVATGNTLTAAPVFLRLTD